MSLGLMFSLHKYLPSQLPPLCNVGIVVTCIYCSVLVIFKKQLVLVLFLLLHFQLSALNLCEGENDLIHLTHLVVCNPTTMLFVIGNNICHPMVTLPCVFVILCFSKKNLTLNSRILVVFLSLKHFKVLFVYNAMVMNDHFKVLLFAMQSLFPSNLVPSATMFLIHTIVMVMHSDATRNPKTHITLNT